MKRANASGTPSPGRVESKEERRVSQRRRGRSRKCRRCGGNQVVLTGEKVALPGAGEGDVVRPCECASFIRGAKAAAYVASDYNGSTTHAYRLDDCILGKLNIDRRSKPRRNLKALQVRKDSWLAGFAAALAEVHHSDSARICFAANSVGLTIEVAKKIGLSETARRELKRAGIRSK